MAKETHEERTKRVGILEELLHEDSFHSSTFDCGVSPTQSMPLKFKTPTSALSTKDVAATIRKPSCVTVTKRSVSLKPKPQSDRNIRMSLHNLSVPNTTAQSVCSSVQEIIKPKKKKKRPSNVHRSQKQCDRTSLQMRTYLNYHVKHNASVVDTLLQS